MRDEQNANERHRGAAGCSTTCTYIGMRFYHFTKELSCRGLWPKIHLERNDFANTLEAMEDFDPTAQTLETCEAGKRFSHCMANYIPSSYNISREQINAKGKQLKTRVEVICLQCAETAKMMETPLWEPGDS